MSEFDPIIREFIKRRRLVQRERVLLRREDYEGREALWDRALDEIQGALSEAWNREIERLIAVSALEEE